MRLSLNVSHNNYKTRLFYLYSSSHICPPCYPYLITGITMAQVSLLSYYGTYRVRQTLTPSLSPRNPSLSPEQDLRRRDPSRSRQAPSSFGPSHEYRNRVLHCLFTSVGSLSVLSPLPTPNVSLYVSRGFEGLRSKLLCETKYTISKIHLKSQGQPQGQPYVQEDWTSRLFRTEEGTKTRRCVVLFRLVYLK